MERKYSHLPTSQLEQERASLEHRLSSAQSVLEGIANPDWVTNQRNLRTPSSLRWGRKLDLQGLNPEQYYSRLSAVIIPIQKTLLTTAIPDFKANLGQVSLEINRRQALLEQSKTQDILRTNLSQAPLIEIHATLESIIQKTWIDSPETGVLGILQQVAAKYKYTPAIKQQEAMQAASSIDANTASMGKNVLIWINSKTILNAVEDFLTDNPEENDELIQEVFVTLIKNLHRLYSSTYPVSQNIHNITALAAAQAVAKRENMPVGLITSQKHQEVKRLVDWALNSIPLGLDKAKIDYLAQIIHQRTGLNKTVLKRYIEYRNVVTGVEPEEVNLEIDPKKLTEDVEDILDTLTNREARTIRLRFGLVDGRDWTLEEIGNEYGVSRERIRQVEAKAFRKLRHPSRTRKISHYLKGEKVDRPIAFFAEGSERFGRIGHFQIPPEQVTAVAKPLVELSETEQKALFEAGISDITGFFTTPPEEMFKEGDPSLISAAKKVVAKLEGVYDGWSDYHSLLEREEKRQANADLLRAIAYAIDKPDRGETESLYWREDSVARKYVSSSEKETWLNWVETKFPFKDLDSICNFTYEAYQRLQNYLKDK